MSDLGLLGPLVYHMKSLPPCIKIDIDQYQFAYLVTLGNVVYNVVWQNLRIFMPKNPFQSNLNVILKKPFQSNFNVVLLDFEHKS